MNKVILASIFSISFLLFTGATVSAQTDTTEFVKSKMYVVTTMNGATFVGNIITDNSKEIVIKTKDRGEVSIPKYEVKSMKELVEGELSDDGVFIGTPMFATRYFLTTNALPMKKGDNYIQLNWWGPEFHFGVGEKFGIGIMTSWGGVPIVGAAKYTINLGEKSNLGLGTLIGTGSWAMPEFFGALPFAALTFGDERRNINFSGGYGYVNAGFGGGGTALLSVGGAARMGNKANFVFDSFIIPESNSTSTMAIIIPGMRFQTEEGKAFQWGFGGIFADGRILPFPFLTWFRKL